MFDRSTNALEMASARWFRTLFDVNFFTQKLTTGEPTTGNGYLRHQLLVASTYVHTFSFAHHKNSKWWSNVSHFSVCYHTLNNKQSPHSFRISDCHGERTQSTSNSNLQGLLIAIARVTISKVKKCTHYPRLPKDHSKHFVILLSPHSQLHHVEPSFRPSSHSMAVFGRKKYHSRS